MSRYPNECSWQKGGQVRRTGQTPCNWKCSGEQNTTAHSHKQGFLGLHARCNSPVNINVQNFIHLRSFAMINAMINQKWELRCPTGGTLKPAGEGKGGGGECALNVGLAVPGGVVPGHKRHHPQAAYLPGCRVHPQLRAHLIDRRQLPCRAKAMTGTLVTVQMTRCVCP